MTIRRMDRVQFFQSLAGLDDDRLKKVLWNLYWRGSAAMRERIERELEPDQENRKHRSKPSVDPEEVRAGVSTFVELALSGAYLAGDRRVSPRERTRWRFTFKDLVDGAGQALLEDDLEDGADAMEQLIDLACEMRGYDYFRSDDPVEAARFIVSDAVALLWSRMRDQLGFAGFAGRAAPQLLRWESRHGWTRRGYGRTSEKETSLASVLGRMLPVHDMWLQFTDCYLDALDQAAQGDGSRPEHDWRADRSSRDRSADLAEWHHLLIERLFGSEAEDRLDKLSRHPALAGPEMLFFGAQLAHKRGETGLARGLMTEALEDLPGHKAFLDFAIAIGAPLPPRAEQVLERRAPGPALPLS